MNKIIKQTQGNKKLRQYIDDLLRNKHFTPMIKELMIALRDNSANYGEELDRLLNGYEKLDKKAKSFFKKHFSRLDVVLNKIVEQYGLDMELLRPVLMINALTGKESEETRDILLYGAGQIDMCFINDNYDENFASEPPFPLSLNPRKQDHIKAFPISIDLHRFATKRDILDFIEKEWPKIQETLGIYREYKNIKFRKRKLDRKLLDFIWDHRDLSIKELKKLLDKEFSNIELVYYELYKILSLEKQRRNMKIIVGQ